MSCLASRSISRSSNGAQPEPCAPDLDRQLGQHAHRQVEEGSDIAVGQRRREFDLLEREHRRRGGDDDRLGADGAAIGDAGDAGHVPEDFPHRRRQFDRHVGAEMRDQRAEPLLGEVVRIEIGGGLKVADRYLVVVGAKIHRPGEGGGGARRMARGEQHRKTLVVTA